MGRLLSRELTVDSSTPLSTLSTVRSQPSTCNPGAHVLLVVFSSTGYILVLSLGIPPGPAHGFSTSVIFTHHTLPSKKTTSSGQLPMTPTGCGSLLLSNPPAHTERVTHVILNVHCHVSVLTLKTVCFYLKIYFLKGKDYLLGFFVSPRIPYLIACVLLLFLNF